MAEELHDIVVQRYIIRLLYKAIKLFETTPELQHIEKALRQRYDEERVKLYRLIETKQKM